MEKYRKVFLIAGHHFNPGKQDPGAVSDGFKENEFTVEDRDGIKYFLNKHYPGITVFVDDDSKTLSQVISWIKSIEGNDSLIYDIHYNSASSNKATGVEAFVSDNASKKSHEIAQGFINVVESITGLKNRGVKTESDSARGRLGILHTKSPATIVEMGFINNPLDRDTIKKWAGWIYEDLAHEIAKRALIK